MLKVGLGNTSFKAVSFKKEEKKQAQPLAGNIKPPTPKTPAEKFPGYAYPPLAGLIAPQTPKAPKPVVVPPLAGVIAAPTPKTPEIKPDVKPPLAGIIAAPEVEKLNEDEKK